jgi:hypothetical protein
VTARIVPRSGAFSGRFTLAEANLFSPRPPVIVRRANYQGLIVRTKVGADWVPQGIGYFILPQLPNQDERNLSGLVTLDKYVPVP